MGEGGGKIHLSRRSAVWRVTLWWCAALLLLAALTGGLQVLYRVCTASRTVQWLYPYLFDVSATTADSADTLMRILVRPIKYKRQSQHRAPQLHSHVLVMFS